MEVANEAASVFAFNVTKSSVEDRGVGPVGGGTLSVIDARETLGSESWGKGGGIGGELGIIAHGF